MRTADDQGFVMALACTRLKFHRDQEPVAVTFLSSASRKALGVR
jgi:hypothetical protein